MATLSYHNFLIGLIDLRSDKDLNSCYEILYKGITGENRDGILSVINTPYFRPLLDDMSNYFLSKEEYEKCEVIRKILTPSS